MIDAANVWPYAILGLVFFLTIMLAMRSSRKQARQFRMQTLQAQQQWLIQQQKFVGNNNNNPNATATAQRPTRASTLVTNPTVNKPPTTPPDYQNIKKP